jgi:hypothetical protein
MGAQNPPLNLIFTIEVRPKKNGSGFKPAPLQMESSSFRILDYCGKNLRGQSLSFTANDR